MLQRAALHALRAAGAAAGCSGRARTGLAPRTASWPWLALLRPRSSQSAGRAAGRRQSAAGAAVGPHSRCTTPQLHVAAPAASTSPRCGAAACSTRLLTEDAPCVQGWQAQQAQGQHGKGLHLCGSQARCSRGNAGRRERCRVSGAFGWAEGPSQLMSAPVGGERQPGGQPPKTQLTAGLSTAQEPIGLV